MLAVSLALAAVLFAGGSDTTPAPAAVLATATPAADSGAATASAQPDANTIPADLQARLDALPSKLRDEAVEAYRSGQLALAQLDLIARQYENRNPNLRVGSVQDAFAGRLRFEVYTTGERIEVATAEGTAIRRGGAGIALEDLQPDELVLVVTSADGSVALSIEAFGVAAP